MAYDFNIKVEILSEKLSSRKLTLLYYYKELMARMWREGRAGLWRSLGPRVRNRNQKMKFTVAETDNLRG